MRPLLHRSFAITRVLKPLEIMFRFLTFRFWVLPDIIVLGEVRCGTTSFCQILATALKEENEEHDDYDDDLNGNEKCDGDNMQEDKCEFFIDCHKPFFLWSHPELDHKETFYSVGHYLGLVAPKYYRMCFPMYIPKWWNEIIRYCYYSISNCFTFQSKKKRQRRQLRKKPLFITFDGCAQYMTSPTTPHLIAQTYKDANQSTTNLNHMC